MSVTGRFMAGLRAFREAYMIAGMEGFDTPAFSQIYDFEGADARATRYDVLWAYYQGNVYRDLHKWSRKLKAEYGLYIHIRDIYNPANRICNFHQTHIWGGYIDVGAGDASEIPSALPIEDTASDSVREAIAQIWAWSRWQVTKDIVTLYGSVFGDVFIRVTDLPEREMVYLERIHPAWLVDVRKNPLDEIEYYEMTYVRRDPEKPDRNVQYSETAELTGSGVTYQTFKDNKPYAWNGNSDKWTVPYPFLPIVHIKHNNVGLDWGWSELFPKLSTFRELDDQASKLGDQVRKMVDSPWLFTGIKPGKTGGAITIEGMSSEGENPTKKEVERDETPILYAHDPGARAFPLVSELDIEAALSHIKEIAAEVERSYPELRTGGGMGGGQSREVASGRALLIARGEAEDKIEQRRVNYDEKLVTLHRMAMAMASEASYKGFEGFSFEDWDGEATDHRIKALRSVFRPHPTETLDQNRQLWTNAHLAENVGVPLDVFLRDNEWEEKRIIEIINSDMYKLHIEMLVATTQQAEGGGDDDDDGNDEGDTSGRGPLSGGSDFNVSTRKKTEG